MESQKKYLFICQSKSCLKRGSEKIRNQVKSHIKDRGLKKEIRLVNTKCIDACKKGPIIVCGNKLFQEVAEEKIEEVVNLCV